MDNVRFKSTAQLALFAPWLSLEVDDRVCSGECLGGNICKERKDEWALVCVCVCTTVHVCVWLESHSYYYYSQRVETKPYVHWHHFHEVQCFVTHRCRFITVLSLSFRCWSNYWVFTFYFLLGATLYNASFSRGDKIFNDAQVMMFNRGCHFKVCDSKDSRGGGCSLLAGYHALDGAVLTRTEHVEGLLELFKLKVMRDERLHVH